jgi:hypothetical protein
MVEKGKINQEGDLVLINYKEKPMSYARIEEIRPDSKRDWYQVKLLFLTIPSQVVTWILREEYINGHPFTMGGEQMRLDKVERVSPGKAPEDNGRPQGPKSPHKPSKVIAFKKSV